MICAPQPATSGRLLQPGRMVRRPASRCPACWSCEQPGWRLGAAGLGLLGPGRARRLQGDAGHGGGFQGGSWLMPRRGSLWLHQPF